MEYGFVRLSRKFFEHTYWKQKRSLSFAEAWLDLIQMARFDVNPLTKLLACGREITIYRGEIHASLRYLAERWSWSVDKTRKFVGRCIKKKEISRRYVQGETVLTLCSYALYNPVANTGQHDSRYTDQHSGQTAASTNNKKDKEGKEGEEYVNTPDFEKFLLFERWIDDNAPSVARMKEPFTFQQYKTIRAEYPYELIKSLLLDMHNWQGLTTKRVSANLTFRKWAKRS